MPCRPRLGARLSPAASAARSCDGKLKAGDVHESTTSSRSTSTSASSPRTSSILRRARTAARLLPGHLENVSVLDPTCGSGAFLFAALNILEPLYEACLDRMQAFVEDLEAFGRQASPEEVRGLPPVLEEVDAAPEPPLLHPQVDHRQQPLRRGHHGGGGRNLQAPAVPEARRPGRERQIRSSRCRTSTSTSAPATRWSASPPLDDVKSAWKATSGFDKKRLTASSKKRKSSIALPDIP